MDERFVNDCGPLEQTFQGFAMDYDWELRARRVIRRLRIDRRKNSTKDLAKDRSVQRLHGLNRVCDEKMAATTQAVMVVVP